MLYPCWAIASQFAEERSRGVFRRECNESTRTVIGNSLSGFRIVQAAGRRLRDPLSGEDAGSRLPRAEKPPRRSFAATTRWPQGTAVRPAQRHVKLAESSQKVVGLDFE